MIPTSKSHQPQQLSLPAQLLHRALSLVPFRSRSEKDGARETEIERRIREALQKRKQEQQQEQESGGAAAAAAAAAASAASDSISKLSVEDPAPKVADPPVPPSPGKHFHHHISSLNAIALKFPKADVAFKEIRKTFDQYDKDHSNAIDLGELKECFKELKVSLTAMEIKQLFEEADMDSSNEVQFKEFILLMAIVHLLKPSYAPGGVRFGNPRVEAAFDMVEDAFLFFDKDGDGYLSKQEVIESLKGGKEGMAGTAATQRFAEMDYNTDGHCSFKEFLFAYVGWVGTAEEDEDEEDDEDGSHN